MAKPLPEKIYITGPRIDPENLKASAKEALPKDMSKAVVSPDDLLAAVRIKYAAYYTEKARRLDPSQDGVAQEALDCLEELKAAGRSSSEMWETYGYSDRSTVKPALREEKRLIKELQTNPSKDVVESAEVCLKKDDVMEKYSITEYVKPKDESLEFELEPVVVEK